MDYLISFTIMLFCLLYIWMFYSQFNRLSDESKIKFTFILQEFRFLIVIFILPLSIYTEMFNENVMFILYNLILFIFSIIILYYFYIKNL